MAEVLSVEVGDRFQNDVADIVEVVKIWFEYSVDDQRWETSVGWERTYPMQEPFQTSGKARDFVKILNDGQFSRIEKKQEIHSNGETPPTTSPLSPTFPSKSTDPRVVQMEEAFWMNASKYGLSSSDLGRTITLGTGRKQKYFRLVGARPSNWKKPILIQGKSGGVYKITAEQAKDALR